MKQTMTAVAATAIALLGAATPPADAAGSPFLSGKFKVELEGVQRTTWESHHTQQFECDSSSDGTGRETVRFRSKPAVVAVAAIGASTPIILQNRKTAILDLRSKITRQGDLNDYGGKICSYGDGTDATPPAPDCGTKSSTLYAELAYDSQRRGFIGLEQSLAVPLGPFLNCPVDGTAWPTLLDRNIATSRMIGQRLPVRGLFKHGKNIVIARGREVVSTGETTSTTTIRWTLSLTRIGNEKGS
jgi:hypothetical protein